MNQALLIDIANSMKSQLRDGIYDGFIIIIWIQAKYIAQCMEEIKLELRQENINVKCNAVAKLTYVSAFSLCKFQVVDG